MNDSKSAPIKSGIPARERLIFALDVADMDRARKLISTLWGEQVEVDQLPGE